MEGKSCANSKYHNPNDGEACNAIEQLEGEPMLGDVIWVKLHGDSWWPAVVFGSNVSGDRETKDVRVRLIGSYEYMFVDPIKCCSEFHIALEKNNGSCEDIFRKALEQDISRSNSSRVKGKVAKSKDGEKATRKASKQDGVKRKLKLDSPNAEKNPKSKTSNRGRMQKKLKQKSSSSNEQVEKTEEHDSAQKRVELKKHDGKEKHSPRTALRVKSRSSKQDEDAASAGRSQELSTRRTKVMQTLGLIAPSGSPFHQKDRFV